MLANEILFDYESLTPLMRLISIPILKKRYDTIFYVKEIEKEKCINIGNYLNKPFDFSSLFCYDTIHL